ncbi:MAG: hypothetical protein A3K90_03965 [Pelodictyon luteolum]|uniref:Uncharacterized protein n=1 Tax=Pelodictyon luteolum TaxID=1100 RepID=A0A165LTL9_PELLU|nr:hypothetical protein [Pelodictyon luteolum]KZK74414.1 MAG: hypothetical protein A3K90_03965 [Pelodictyon luteolum]
MAAIDDSLAWAEIPVPETIRRMEQHQQEAVALWTRSVVDAKTEGFDELYQAISMIVKYIPHFVVIPLMVEHIRPKIAAGVCLKMGVEQATGYANDLPPEYFTEVSRHIDPPILAEILGRMKKHHAEKFIISELRHHLARMLQIAEHLDDRMLETVARHVTLPEHQDDLLKHPHTSLFSRIRQMQK